MTFCRKRNVNKFSKLSSSAIGLWQVLMAQRHVLE